MPRDIFVLTRGDDEVVHFADWLEVRAATNPNRIASIDDLARALQQATDYSPPVARSKAEDAFVELSSRAIACGGGSPGDFGNYPFELDGNVVRCVGPVSNNMSDAHLAYMFLLALSRHNMSSKTRKIAGHDGTQLFEELSESVLGGFFAAGASSKGGAKRFRTLATAFKDCVSEMCKIAHSGGCAVPKARSPGGGDGGVDIFAWRTFSDRREGALLAFAQCKTGINWRNHTTRTIPAEFCRRYIVPRPTVDPLRIYMVPVRVDGRDWSDVVGEAGILFDRCRIVDWSSKIAPSLFERCHAWASGVLG